MAMEKLQDLMDRVRQTGCRLTKQRAVILQALCELEGHASAEAVYAQVTMHRRDVDLSTVYRTLETLRDLRILSQTDLGRGCVEFEVVTEKPHHHLVCKGCGRVLDLDDQYLVPVAEAIRRELGFEPILDHLAIFGWCQACRNENERATSALVEREAEARSKPSLHQDRAWKGTVVCIFRMDS
jgi:Fur family ferric uptake transcriptional regulator